MLSEQGGSLQWPPSQLKAEQRDDGPALRLVDENASGTRGNLRTWVWVYIGPTWLDMTPTTQEGDRYDRVGAVLFGGPKLCARTGGTG